MGAGDGVGGGDAECPLSDPAELAKPTVAAGLRVTTPTGAIELSDGALVLDGDIGTHLCMEFRATDPPLGEVDVVDARRVTFLGSPGLSLLAAVVKARGLGLPLWADHRAVCRPLELAGLTDLFDVRPVEG